MSDQNKAEGGGQFPEANRLIDKIKTRPWPGLTASVREFLKKGLTEDLVIKINHASYFSLRDVEQLALHLNKKFNVMETAQLHMVLQQLHMIDYANLTPSVRHALPGMLAEATGLPAERFNIRALQIIETPKSGANRFKTGVGLALLTCIFGTTIFLYGNKFAAIIVDFTNVKGPESAEILQTNFQIPPIPSLDPTPAEKKPAAKILFSGAVESTTPGKTLHAMAGAIASEELRGKLYKVQLKVERISDGDYGDPHR